MQNQKNIFGTDGIRGRVGTAPISVDWMLKLGWAIGITLVQHENSKVLIGKDTRISGYMFESALEAGLVSVGVDTYLIGCPMPTPGIAYLTRTLQADVGIVISASHNLYYDNGLKFFSREGLKFSDSMELAVEQKLLSNLTTVKSVHIGRTTRVGDASGRYIEFCKSTFPQQYDLRGLKIVIDCANGAAYHIAPSVFQELGAEVIALNVLPNGLNINQSCGSTSPEILAENVVESRADLGIALDGDGDRAIFVDHKGVIVDGDVLLFIIAKWYQNSGRLKGGVVGTLMSNLGLERAMNDLKIPFFRTKVGDKYVLEGLKKQSCNLGGEPSGHILCLDAHTTGDGIISALKVLAALCFYGCSLYDMRRKMIKYPQILKNVPVLTREPILINQHIQIAIKQAERRLNGEGRVLLRASGTEPVIRIMVAGQDQFMIEQIAYDLEKTVVKYFQPIPSCF